jgi:hypothetical protein
MSPPDLDGAGQLDGRVFFELGQDGLGDQAVGLHQRHGFQGFVGLQGEVAAAQGETGDVDLMLAQHGADVADHPRHVVVLHEDEMAGQGGARSQMRMISHSREASAAHLPTDRGTAQKSGSSPKPTGALRGSCYLPSTEGPGISWPLVLLARSSRPLPVEPGTGCSGHRKQIERRP